MPIGCGPRYERYRTIPDMRWQVEALGVEGLKGWTRCALHRAGATFIDGKLVERPHQQKEEHQQQEEYLTTSDRR